MSEVLQGNKIIDKIKGRMDKREAFFSFEYFPPKTEQGVKNLDQRMTSMARRGPVWMDMTWGAGGSTSELTLDLCKKIQCEKKVDALMHLTCTNMDSKKIVDALDECKKVGIRNILALRGDPPKGQERWVATEGGFTCGLDLIKYIRKTYADFFCVACAGYPEGHPNVRKEIKDESWDPKTNTPKYWGLRPLGGGKYEGVSPSDWKTEIQYLKAKVDAGADFIITQLFYDLDVFFAWVKECRKAGITCPILPGVMPLFKAGSFSRMTGFCKTIVPEDISAKVEEFKNNTKENNAAFQKWGVGYVADMCTKLLGSGLVPSIHLYTLNNQKVPYAILDKLGFPETVSQTPTSLSRSFSLDIFSKRVDQGWRSALLGKEGGDSESKQAATKATVAAAQ